MSRALKQKLLAALTTSAALLAMVSVRAGAAPLAGLMPDRVFAGPCAPGAGYDPACDVDHDGDVDIMDIQLTSAHFGSSGMWFSDNNHNHLGQTWSGSNSPLVIGGAFDGVSAPLSLSNNTGHGLLVTAAGWNGVSVQSAVENGFAVSSADTGLWVGAAGTGVNIDSATLYGVAINTATDKGISIGSAGHVGLYVHQAGMPSQVIPEPDHLHSGINVAGAEWAGLTVGRSDHYGVLVRSAAEAGLYVQSASYGVTVESALTGMVIMATTNGPGVLVGAAGADGMRVVQAGNPSATNISWSTNDGFEVDGAEGHGLFIGRADQWGINIQSAGVDGIGIGEAARNGVVVSAAGMNGMEVIAAGNVGVQAAGNNLAANFLGPVQISGGCTGCELVTFGINASDRTLQPGDVVTVSGVRESGVDGIPVLMALQLAEPGRGVAGVVVGRAALTAPEGSMAAGAGRLLVPREGPARPGDFVTIVYSGLAQARLAPGAGDVAAGERLTIAGDGMVRPLGSIAVQLAGDAGTVALAENAPVVGLALDAARSGRVWVLVNPQ